MKLALRFIIAVNLFVLIGMIWLASNKAEPTTTSAWSQLAPPTKPVKPPLSMSTRQLMNAEQERYYRTKLPVCNDSFANSLVGNPSLIWYTEKEIPCSYQLNLAGNTVTGFHDCKHNISGDPIETQKPHGKGGNANIEFPWLTGGTDKCNNVNSVKFLLLDKPVEVYRPSYPSERSVAPGRGYGWVFPKGSIVGELLLMKGPNGEDYCFELRLRIRDDQGWDVEIFRPYPTAKDLAEAIRDKRPNDPRADQVENSVPKMQRLVDSDHDDEIAFDVTAGVDHLPVLEEQLVYELLTDVVFKSAKDKTWKGDDCFAPTTNGWNIVPAKYNGTFLGTDRESCNKCHENTFDHATKFDLSRGWYGFVRGSDEILSWHPIDPASMRKDASYERPRILPFWEKHGLVKWRDAR